MAIEAANVISMQEVQKMLDGLNPNQRQAAETMYGPVLILAGAGSGKTHTMTVRLANMMAHGVKPEEIFVATFTNKAAREMKERIAKVVGEETVKNLWMGTFHSLCVRILRKHGHFLGYESNYTIYDTGDCLSVIERIYKMMKIDEKYKAGLALHYIDNAKNNLWTPEYCLTNNAETPTDEVMALVYQQYQALLKEANAMDFGDLIANVVFVMDQEPEVCEYWQRRFVYVLSDEYQDANHAQYQLLRYLAWPQNNLFVVG